MYIDDLYLRIENFKNNFNVCRDCNIKVVCFIFFEDCIEL